MIDNDEMSQTQNVSCGNLNVPDETVFHAVYIPHDNNETSELNTKESIHVYEDKIEALKVIKEFKTGRFKTFKNRSEAEEFAKGGFENTNYVTNNFATSSAPVIGEKSSNFKAPRSQDLVCFRKLIESGDLDAVKSTVWGNPRYLISIGDTPAILQEGCRYNALHIAVKAEKPDMCELILNTVGDTKFIELLYGEEECNSYLDRAQIMLDLYLNTPDKGLNETPLHFAVKFGLKDVVRVLISYPRCLKTLPNKYKQMPMDIICSRKCQENEELKKEICMLLEDQYYVPVLRSEDTTLQPVIGEPFTPASPLSLNTDPISPRLEVRAFAGPMTKSRAVEFRKKWKTPPRLCVTPIKKTSVDEVNNTPNSSIALRLQDTEKGLERVGRDLAEEYQVSWKEYWPFLNDFADFRTAEGLVKLEKYLEHRGTDNQINSLCNNILKLIIDKSDRENNDIDDSEFFTPPSSPKFTRADSSEDEMENAEEGVVTFLEGSAPTKADYAVYNAVSSSIDLNTHPNIYRWRHDMQLAMKRESSRFDNTKMIRRKLFMTS